MMSKLHLALLGRFRGAIRPSTSAHSVIIPTIQLYETDWRAARAGANIEALSPVVAESVVSAQFREIRRHRIVVEGFNPSRRHHA